MKLRFVHHREAQSPLVHRRRVRILVAEESYSLVESEAPHASMPPLHVHHGHDEVFYVLGGRLSVHLPGTSVELAAAGARHDIEVLGPPGMLPS